jgi:DNA-binding transcriptional ArsR family regulator
MGYLNSATDNGGKITLDRKTFKILASETRVGILKKLDRRQMTVSDLARTLDMNKATVFEHLEKLIDAGLIKKKEDERKWVYYSLTWKGKNILHPERTKIAIVLGVSLICFILVVYLISYVLISFIPADQSPFAKYQAPSIEFTTVDDITELTATPVNVEIEVNDDGELNEQSLMVEHTVSDTYTNNPELLGGWQMVPANISFGKVTLSLPPTNWSTHTGGYLYIRCWIADTTGNSGQNIYVEYIEEISSDSIDLSITTADVSFTKDVRSISKTGSQVVPIEVKVHNNGPIDAMYVNLSIFANDPDLDDDGLIDDFSFLLYYQNIQHIESRNFTTIVANLTLDLSHSDNFWISVDPYNVINESNELNNIANIKLQTFYSRTIVPEFATYGLIISLILIVLFYGHFKRRS